MFGFGKLNRTTENVIVSLEIFFDRFDSTRSVPKCVWQDKYCFGYIVGAVSMLSKVHGGRNFGGEDLGKLMMRVYEHFNPGEGLSMIKTANDLMGQRENNYLIGMDMGAKSVQIFFAPQSLTNDRQFLECRAEAEHVSRALGHRSREVSGGEIAAVFDDHYFFKLAKELVEK